MRYKELLPFRNAWLGFAMLWVILIHTPFNLGPLNYLRAIGCGGVDICIFASGIGCFYSLSKDGNAGSFMVRRLKRLAPAYILFIVFWLFYQYCLGNFNFQMAIGNLFAIQTLTGLENDFNWYISAIFLLYVLAPYFKAAAEQSTWKKHLFLLLLLIGSVPFWRVDAYMVIVTRVPIFYLGMLFADLCKKDKQIKKADVFCMAIAFVAGAIFAVGTYLYAREYLWSHGLYWYPFLFIAPPMCFAVSWIAMHLNKRKLTKPIVDFLSLCGDYSFELYLVHILLFSLVPTIMLRFGLTHIRNLLWFGCILCVPMGCFLLRRGALLLSRLFSKSKTPV